MPSLIDVFRPIYDRILRPLLPLKIAVYNGVAVRNVRLFDITDVYPDYEWPLIDGIRAQVSPGDTVIVVGGGIGVSSIVAAEQVGSTGEVITYEGARDRFRLLDDTANLNKVGSRITFRHAIVGQGIRLSGAKGDAKEIPPSDLPDCDVLVMDCEGAEREILADGDVLARSIIVETHGFLGAPESTVRELIVENGYEVVSREKEDLAREVPVFVAVRSELPQ